MLKTEEVVTLSVHRACKYTLSFTAWEGINEPGTFVERESGDLYRFSKESLSPAESPTVVQESSGSSVLLKISDDPFITSFEARLMCAQHNIEPNF